MTADIRNTQAPDAQGARLEKPRTLQIRRQLTETRLPDQAAGEENHEPA